MSSDEISSVNAASSDNAAPVGSAENDGAEQGPSGEGSASGSTQVKSLAELQELAPEVYKKMLEGIASNICAAMREHTERFKKIVREGREAAG